MCSYAEMDIRRHGNPGWSVFPESRPMSTQMEQAELGKTEMSLVHFQVSKDDPCPLTFDLVQLHMQAGYVLPLSFTCLLNRVMWVCWVCWV